MLTKIDEFKWIQNTSVDFFYVEETFDSEEDNAERFRVVFGMRNGHVLRSKKFKTPKEAENFAHTLISMRCQED